MTLFFLKGPLAHLAPSEGYIELKERVCRATCATDYAEVKLKTEHFNLMLYQK